MIHISIEEVLKNIPISLENIQTSFLARKVLSQNWLNFSRFGDPLADMLGVKKNK